MELLEASFGATSHGLHGRCLSGAGRHATGVAPAVGLYSSQVSAGSLADNVTERARTVTGRYVVLPREPTWKLDAAIRQIQAGALSRGGCVASGVHRAPDAAKYI